MSVQLLTIPIRSCVMLALAWAMPAAACGDSQPTFSRDIAPIIFANCSECHRPGQAAPFSLLTYEDAHKRAKQIAQVTHSRFMPPWLPQPSEGRAGVMNERRLTAEQIDLIQQWENGGAVEGDPKDLPQLPQFKKAGAWASRI